MQRTRRVEGPWRASCQLKKALRGSETETRELLGGTEENSVSPMRGHWFALQANQWVFTKSQQNRIELVARPVHGRSRHCCLRDGLQDLLKWLERGGPAPSGWSLGCKQHPLSQRGRSLSMMIQGLCFQPMVWAQNCWPGIATNSFPTPVHLSINFFTIYVGCLGTRPLHALLSIKILSQFQY